MPVRTSTVGAAVRYGSVKSRPSRSGVGVIRSRAGPRRQMTAHDPVEVDDHDVHRPDRTLARSRASSYSKPPVGCFAVPSQKPASGTPRWRPSAPPPAGVKVPAEPEIEPQPTRTQSTPRQTAAARTDRAAGPRRLSGFSCALPRGDSTAAHGRTRLTAGRRSGPVDRRAEGTSTLRRVGAQHVAMFDPTGEPAVRVGDR